MSAAEALWATTRTSEVAATAAITIRVTLQFPQTDATSEQAVQPAPYPNKRRSSHEKVLPQYFEKYQGMLRKYHETGNHRHPAGAARTMAAPPSTRCPRSSRR